MPSKNSASPRGDTSPHLFPQGPAIAIIVQAHAGMLESIHLETAPSYQCHYAESLSPHIQRALFDYLEAYGKKEKRDPFDLRILEGSDALEKLTLFRRRVFRAMQRIPFGEVLAYGDVAARTGQPQAARAVGTACRCNPFQLLIPCHRVTAARGELGGYAAGLDLKRLLLEFESSR